MPPRRRGRGGSSRGSGSGGGGGGTVAQCLASICVDVPALTGTLEQQWRAVKKAYFARVLACHPDKGGDAAVFREVQSAFEVLRELYDSGNLPSLASEGSRAMPTAEVYEAKWEGMADMPVPSWEFYAAAAEEPVPTYLVELAKSGRSACVATGIGKKCPGDEPGSSLIPKGELRVGRLHETGTYGRWVHLSCWRVPSKVWLGVPAPEECCAPATYEAALLGMNEVLLAGLRNLPQRDRDAVVAHVMDRGNWAKLVKRREQAPQEGDGMGEGGASRKQAAKLEPQTAKKAVVPQGFHAHRGAFVIPVPGQGGARPNCLAGQTVVMTGVFPEVGGGSGLMLGKDKVKAMVERFGGRVTGSVSGRTTLLLVGKEPGFSKVSKARDAEACKLLSLRDLKRVIEGASLEDAGRQPMVIQDFSAGYGGNSVAARLPAAVVARVAGKAAATIKPRQGTAAAVASEAPPVGNKAGRRQSAKARAEPPPLDKPKPRTMARAGAGNGAAKSAKSERQPRASTGRPKKGKDTSEPEDMPKAVSMAKTAAGKRRPKKAGPQHEPEDKHGQPQEPLPGSSTTQTMATRKRKLSRAVAPSAVEAKVDTKRPKRGRPTKSRVG